LIVTFRFSHLLLASSAGLALSGCGSAKVADAPSTVVPPYAEIASYKLQIEVREGQCILNYNGPFRGQVETGIPAPCQFLQDSVGNIQHMELTNTRQNGGGTYSVVIILGGPPAIDGRSSKPTEGCGSQSLALSLSPRGIALGSVGTGLDICPTDRVDEKLFTADFRHV
jgi:hypothetical protein